MPRLLNGLASFEGTGVMPRFLILDDGWQHTNVNDRHNGEQWSGRLTSFNANFKFSDLYAPVEKPDAEAPLTVVGGKTSLKRKRSAAEDAAALAEAEDADFNVDSEHSLLQVVQQVKAQTGIRYLLAWHAFTGYWGGVQPGNGSATANGNVSDAATKAAAANGSNASNGSNGSSSSSSSDSDNRIIVRRKSKDAAGGAEVVKKPTNGAANGQGAASGVSLLKEDYGTAIAFPELNAPLYRMARSGALDSEPFKVQGVGLVHPQRASDFFDHYHRTLHDFGVDGVKVDVQSVVPLLRHTDASSWQVTTAFHRGLQSSVGRYFGHAPQAAAAVPAKEIAAGEFPIIHCMCHSQATLLSILALYTSPPSLCKAPAAPVPVGDGAGAGAGAGVVDSRGGSSAAVSVVRGSDDFYPTEPLSHGPHIFVNAINSLLMSYVGLHDWDMFQSAMAGRHAVMHAAARAISGGPVYVRYTHTSCTFIYLHELLLHEYTHSPTSLIAAAATAPGSTTARCCSSWRSRAAGFPAAFAMHTQSSSTCCTTRSERWGCRCCCRTSTQRAHW